MRIASFRPEDVRLMERECLAKTVELTDFGKGKTVTGLQQLGTEDKSNDVLIREVNVPAKATSPVLKRSEDKLLGPTPVAILVVRRSLNTLIKKNM